MRGIAPFVLLVLTAACSTDGGSGPETLSMAKAGGDAQVGSAGAALPVAPSVRVTNDAGEGVAGVSVHFAVASGGGTILGPTQSTNAQGVATAGAWTLGPTAGQQTLTASAQDDRVNGTVTFTATAGAGPASQATAHAGATQNGVVASAVDTRPAVRVADQHGNPVAGAAVVFAIASGGGTVSGANATTGADGVATVGSWILGTQSGPQTMTATVAGIAGGPVTFTANAAAGPARDIAVTAGDNQTAAAGTAVAIPPAVIATDLYGNPVQNLTVNFAVASGGGSATGTLQYTEADGTIAVGGWTLGPSPGQNTLTATATGNGIAGNPVTFTATALALLNAAQYAGTWAGTWTNTTFGSVGTTSLTIVVDQNAETVTLTSSSTGNVLGQGGGAPQQSRMAGYQDTGFTLQTTLQLYGDVTMTVDGQGNVTASGVNVPAAGIDRWDATGTITANTMNFNFTIQFTGGGSAVGTVTLNRQ